MTQEEQSTVVEQVTQQVGYFRKDASAIGFKKKFDAALEFERRVNPHVSTKQMQYPVTDLGYYMDGYLRDNLNEVPKFLKKSWDCVIIVSGSAKVRIGKSTMAIQAAYYLAWLLNEKRKKNKQVPKDNPVPFTNDNVAFNPDEVMEKAGKFPRNSVLVYDEGRAGLDSARAMENINKAMQDFFQECGQYGHVIIIVLPDFFKLSETIAIPRSLFLINVYADRDYNRGFFSFFSEHKKELLYIFGKKKYGSTSKYMAVGDNFHGRFTDYFPIDQEIYNERKKEALKKRKKSRLEVKWHLERDMLMYLMKHEKNYTAKVIAEKMQRHPDIKLSEEVIEQACIRINKTLNEQVWKETVE